MMEPIKNIAPLKNFTVYNPATDQPVGTYDIMDRERVGHAVGKARQTFSAWSETPMAQRRRILGKAVTILANNVEKYAGIVASETGKTTLDAMMADIFSALDIFKYYKKNAGKFLKPVRVPGSTFLPGRKAYYTFEPKGVIGIISPWNYPFALLAGPAVSALMAGNTVVIKPASQTTGSGLMFKEIMDQAGMPDGAIQMVTGNGSITGQALIENEDLDMIFFTGSTAVGREISKIAGKRMIPAVMELGGKDAAIVTKNANLDRAAHAIVWGGITNSGQTCIGTELVLVDRRIYDAFEKKIVDLVKNLKSGSEPGDVGSMTMKSQFEIVRSQVEDAKAKGAGILAGGEPLPSPHGLYFPPTVLTNVTEDMKVRTEETFGPLLPLIPYDTIDDAVKIANSTEYGLSGSVFTRDMAEARDIAKQLKTGSVNINDILVTYAIPDLPFGGIKRSGIGTYHGESGIRAFTNVKSITEYKWNINKEPHWYPMTKQGDRLIVNILVVFFSGNLLSRIKALFKLGKPVREMFKAKPS